MPEHYTKNTLEATVWCNRCNAYDATPRGFRSPRTLLAMYGKQKADNEVKRIRKGLAEEAREEREKREPRLF